MVRATGYVNAPRAIDNPSTPLVVSAHHNPREELQMTLAARTRATLAAVTVAAALACRASAATLVVTTASVAYPHYTTIQSAVDAAASGDWILIDVGTYSEAVYITTPNLHLRGMDRNGVVLDGQHQVGNGIEVWKANGVSIENLTVHDFDRATLDGADGNEIWWNGGDGSGTIGITGWRGRYLTTYSTGLLGGYGIFISNSVNGSLDQAYASGFNDSGLYLGACRDCRARISHALVENNCLGYSGTNSGGHVVIQDSIFRNNANGVGPNSLNNDDQPPPQDGACNSGKNTTPLPTFPTTRIRRCTIFRRNTVENNGNLTTPANSTTASIPWGNGIILIGTYADRIEKNIIRNNPNTGLLGLENPDPFPPTASTVYFQLSGNRIVNNTFSGNGTNPDAVSGDITLAGGIFGTMQSVNNCVSGNQMTTSTPPDIQTGWSCHNLTTPNPGFAALARILELQSESQARTSVPQPVPPAQPTMPAPCAGVPANPLCS
jgi:hypothetical protein